MSTKRLTILHTESSTGWAGQEMRIILESREMKKLGHRIIIAARPGSGILPAADREGFEKIIMNMEKSNLILSIVKLMKTITVLDVDIVNTHSSWDSWIASIAARLSRRKPLILRTRHLSTPVSRGFLSRIVYQYLPHLVMTTGSAIRENLINVNRYPERKIISIPTGVDPDIFYPRPLNTELRRELGIGDKDRAIGTIAALRSWKGHDYLLDAAKILIEHNKTIKFVLAGEGPRHGYLAEKVSSLGIKDNVLFLGYRNDVHDILSALDIVVLPSYANEGVPQALLQAMAMEKPVVACSAGSIPEIVRDRETGILVEPKDPGALAGAITEILGNRDLASTVSASAKQMVDTRYSLKNMISSITDIYNKMCRQET